MTKELRALIVLAGKFDPSLQAAMLKATGQSQKLSQSLKHSTNGLNNMMTIAKGSFLGNLGANAVSKLAYEVENLGIASIGMASDLNEVQNVVNVTFGKSANEINAWSKQALRAYGLSELQAKQYNGTMGAMLKSSKVADQYIVQMSEGLTGLAGDMASFYNLSHDDAWTKIQAGISGETEPLRRLGINMTVANLEAFALSKGIKTAYQNMDQASQVTLRYNYLMEATTAAQGDFNRTEKEAANQWRLLKTNILQTGSSLAQKLLPHLNQLQIKANNYFQNADVGAWAATASLWFDRLASSVQWVIDNWYWLGPAAEQVVGMFIAMKVIGEVTSMIYGLKAAIALLNLTLNGCALFLLINGLVWLVTHWDTVKSKLKSLDDAFRPEPNGEIQMFAEGGIAQKPSIFGDDGPEMAIPLRRTPRSLSLLNQTAQMLGAGSGSVVITYAPNISGASGPEVKQALDLSFEEFKAWAEQYFEGRERVSFV